MSGLLNSPHGSSCLKTYDVSVASSSERQELRRLRHRVYAEELGQYQINSAGELSDNLDLISTVLVVKKRGDICGFVSITPPNAPSFSFDKYFSREHVSFEVDNTLFEVRVLTVEKDTRHQEAAALLLYGAFRWVEAHGGAKIVAIGRKEVLSLYLKIGMQDQGLTVQAGAVCYSLLLGDLHALRTFVEANQRLIDHLRDITEWKLPFGFSRPCSCFHGGAFFEAIGKRFNDLKKSALIINADVLDAWYPPSPKVLSAIADRLDWLTRTSPPTDCMGLIEVIAEIRNLNPLCILPGAGSSDLIFRCFREWLDSTSRALILSPTYGEYEHILEQVIGCQVDRCVLNRETLFRLDLEEWTSIASTGNYDLVVLVNPNSPTGQFIPKTLLSAALSRIPTTTKVWIDETYIEYAGTDESLEFLASHSENLIVCKSMSKIYALSGMRVGYLCASAHILEGLKAITPPWVVGLLAQVAAVNALQDWHYYLNRINETHLLRESLSNDLTALGLRVFPSNTNFFLFELSKGGPDSRELLSNCRKKGLFLRDPLLSSKLDHDRRLVRIAVKDVQTNCRMTNILRGVFQQD